MNDARVRDSGFMVTKIHELARRALGKRLKAAGIEDFKPGQGRILFVLWRGDGITMTDLAQRTAVEKSTLSRALDRLEDDGFIRREYPPDDRRTVRIVLTERSRGMLGTFVEVSQEMGQLFYRGFTPGDIRAFEDALERILENLMNDEET